MFKREQNRTTQSLLTWADEISRQASNLLEELSTTRGLGSVADLEITYQLRRLKLEAELLQAKAKLSADRLPDDPLVSHGSSSSKATNSLLSETSTHTGATKKTNQSLPLPKGEHKTARQRVIDALLKYPFPLRSGILSRLTGWMSEEVKVERFFSLKRDEREAFENEYLERCRSASSASASSKIWILPAINAETLQPERSFLTLSGNTWDLEGRIVTPRTKEIEEKFLTHIHGIEKEYGINRKSPPMARAVSNEIDHETKKQFFGAALEELNNRVRELKKFQDEDRDFRKKAAKNLRARIHREVPFGPSGSEAPFTYAAYFEMWLEMPSAELLDAMDARYKNVK